VRHVLPGSPPPLPLGGAGEAGGGLPLAGDGGGGGGGALPALPGADFGVVGSAALAVWGLLALLLLASIALYAVAAFTLRSPRVAATAARVVGGGVGGGGVGEAPYPIPGDLLELRALLRRAVEAAGLPRGATGMEAAAASGDERLLEAARVYYERLFGGSRGGS